MLLIQQTLITLKMNLFSVHDGSLPDLVLPASWLGWLACWFLLYNAFLLQAGVFSGVGTHDYVVEYWDIHHSADLHQPGGNLYIFFARVSFT